MRKKDKRIAKRRIDILMEEAKKAALEDELERADRYVELARGIGMRHNISLPSEYKRKICSNCYSYLLPSRSCRIRVERGKLIIKCLNCRTINRFVYKD
ncbi:MAG: ribonuclease P protein component 4 [Thermoplasmata archaeon]